jgi:hypothetical protein
LLHKIESLRPNYVWFFFHFFQDFIFMVHKRHILACKRWMHSFMWSILVMRVMQCSGHNIISDFGYISFRYISFRNKIVIILKLHINILGETSFLWFQILCYRVEALSKCHLCIPIIFNEKII